MTAQALYTFPLMSRSTPCLDACKENCCLVCSEEHNSNAPGQNIHRCLTHESIAQ